MNRVIVVGPPGSGKSTVAPLLSRRIDADHVELDELFWEPGWKQADLDTFLERVRLATKGDRWVLAGNYFSKVSDVMWPLADTIVFLDLPRRTTVRRVLTRTVVDLVTRRVLWNDNRQTLRDGLEIVRFAWTAHGTYRDRYARLIGDGAWPNVTWIRLTSARHVRAWLR